MKKRYKHIVNTNKMVKENAPKEDFETLKRDIWIRAWIGVASSSNITEIAKADKWADACLKSFEKRYKDKSTLSDASADK